MSNISGQHFHEVECTRQNFDLMKIEGSLKEQCSGIKLNMRSNIQSDQPSSSIQIQKKDRAWPFGVKQQESNDKQNDQNKVQTQVIKLQKALQNPQTYYFPTFLKIKVKSIAKIETESRIAGVNLEIYLSVSYSSEVVDKAIIQQLKKKIYLNSDYNDPVKLNIQDKNQSKDNQDDDPKIYFAEKNQVLHWNICFKSFELKVQPFVSFHPFTTFEAFSTIKVPAIQLMVQGKAERVVAVFNILDCKDMYRKIIEQAKIAPMGGFEFSSNYMQLNIDREQFSEPFQQPFVEGDDDEQVPQIEIENKESIKQMQLRKQLPIAKDEEVKELSGDFDIITFDQKQGEQINCVKDHFSSAQVKLHFHANLKIATGSYKTNFFFVMLLAILTALIHLQPAQADGIVASVATIGVAFGAFILSIREQVAFKPGLTLFESAILLQMIILFIPLTVFIIHFSISQAQETPTPLNQNWKQYLNSTQYSSTLPPDTILQFDTTLLDYLQSLLQQLQGNSMFIGAENDSGFYVTVVGLFFGLSVLLSIYFAAPRIFKKFKRNKLFQHSIAKGQFTKFSKKIWENKKCRQSMVSLIKWNKEMMADKERLRGGQGQDRAKLIKIGKKLL